VDLRVADIADPALLARTLAGERFDAVVHCAAKTKVVESLAKPELYRRVIVDGTRAVLDAARDSGATRVVNFSSGGVIYGETARCATEASPVAPVSPYGQCKAEAETLVAASGIPSITLRPANIYGTRQRTDLEGGVIALFMRLWRERAPITVRGDGSMERDYVHVSDVATVVLAALDASTTGVYNVGTGVATSVNALVEVLAGVLGPPPPIVRVPEIAGELRRNCVDASRAKRELGWAPRYGLSEGLRQTASS
jgi:UDP-glucose 4-epimerase